MKIYLKYGVAKVLLAVFGLERVGLSFLRTSRKAAAEKHALP